MSPFIIFFIVVTVLYIIYYAVMIFLDLRAVENAESRKDEEDFDVSDIAGQATESVTVRSVQGGEGFQVGELPPSYLGQPDYHDDDSSSGDEPSHDPTAAELQMKECESHMDVIVPMDNDEYSYDDGSVFEYVTEKNRRSIPVRVNTFNDHV